MWSFRSILLLTAALVLVFVLGVTSLAAEVRFGATLTLSGSAAAFGADARDGMELAREEVNAAGGIRGESLRIFYEDIGETDLKRAVSAARKLIDVDKVRVLLPMISEDAEAEWPLIRDSGIIGMAIWAGAPEVTAARPRMFQISSSDVALGRELIDYAVSKKMERFCFLVEQGAYALAIAEGTGRYLTARGFPLTLSLEYPTDTTDFRPLLLKMKQKRCQAILFLTSPNYMGTVLKQLSSIDRQCLRLGLDVSEDAGIRQVAGASIAGLVYAKHAVSTRDFADRFQARFGRSVGIPAALAYDAIRVLAQVMNEHGTASDEVAQGLLALQPVPGASGAVSFDPDGMRKPRKPELWWYPSMTPERML